MNKKEFEIQITTIRFFIRISKNNKYIKSRNYNAWVYKIYIIEQMLERWIISVKEHEIKHR